ncbi:MAG: DUF2231 domain-containing protein [Acidimicrobiia bacterium]
MTTNATTPVGATDALASDSRLDAVVDRLDRVAERLLSDKTATSVLKGVPLGHAVHPMLTDVTIGCWTGATMLDLGGRRTHVAARRFIGLGCLSAVPTILTGLADWQERDLPARRVGAAHAMLNSAALVLYFSSWRARRKGHHLRGVATALIAMNVASAAGYLGGHLAFGSIESEAELVDALAVDITAAEATGLPISEP